APQCVVSQPMCEPVRLRASRRWWISSVRGSTRLSTSLPFTVILTWVLATAFLPMISNGRMVSGECRMDLPPFAIGHSLFAPSARCRSPSGARERPPQRALDHHAPGIGAVLGRAARIGGGRHDGAGGPDGGVHRRLLQRGADHGGRRVLGE